MKKIPLRVVVILTVVLIPLVSAYPSEIRLVDKIGSVYIHLSGTEPDELIEAVDDAVLEEGDQLITGAESSARFMIEGDSIVELGADSDVTIEQSGLAGFQFFLKAGEFFAKVRSLLENKQTMNVRTPIAVAAVRGTELIVSYDPTLDTSQMAVFDEGKISVESISTGEQMELRSGQEVTVVRGLGRLRPTPLHRFEGYRDRLLRLRERRDLLRPQWKMKTSEERREFRKKIQQERRIKVPRQPRLRPSPQPKPVRENQRAPLKKRR